MIDIDEIDREIKRLEHADTTYQNCERLSVLHAVKDKYNNSTEPKQNRYAYSYEMAQSEFIKAFTAAPADEAVGLIDEHMQTIQLLYPREYLAIMRKLEALKQ